MPEIVGVGMRVTETFSVTVLKHGVPVVVSVTVRVLLPIVCQVTDTVFVVAVPLITPPVAVQRNELAPFGGVEYVIV